MTDAYDAIVIGGGPAGTTCAYTLATHGYSVILLEKEQHPRFRIGESVVPYATRLFDEMGILEELENGPFVIKRSVESSDSDGHYFRTRFSSLAEGQHKFGFNVERAPFDEVLCRNAESAGVRVVQRAEVTALLFDGNRVVGVAYQCQGRAGEARARFVADASGRAGLVARQLKLRRMNRRLNNVAVFQYFHGPVKGVNASDEGDLVIATHEDGWIWCIPVGGDTLSVGTVMSAGLLAGRDRQKVFEQHLGQAPRISACLKGATPVFDVFKVESDFCYHTEQFAGPGYFLVGDAACFVDPVFSGGVFLGMVGGRRAAEAMDDIFNGQDEEEAAWWYENFCKTGYDHYFRLVYAFYYGCHGNISSLFRDLFPGRFKLLLQVLAGDFWSFEGNPIWTALRSRPEWATFERAYEPVYGCPVYPDICQRIGLAARAGNG